MQQEDKARLFTALNEIGIIAQLSRALLEAQLPKGLIAPHFAVLNHLIRVRDGSTPVELARAFQVPKTSMTHTLAGLEKHGLVEMRPNPNDRRSKCVWLTDPGRALRDRTIAAMDGDLVHMANGFGADRVLDILPTLTGLREFLDDYRNAEPPRDRPVGG